MSAKQRGILFTYTKKNIKSNYRNQKIALQMHLRLLLNHTSRIISLSIVKAVWGVRWPVVVVSGRKVILHKARWEASKIVWWWWRLVERRWLLVGRERPSEMGRSL